MCYTAPYGAWQGKLSDMLSAKPRESIQEQNFSGEYSRPLQLTFSALAPRFLLEASARRVLMLDSLLTTPFLNQPMSHLIHVACLWSMLQV